MALASESRHGSWSNRWLFVLAAAGSAVGLGNIWKFPYIAGENGGGAFVLIYLACVALVGIPILISEVMLGRAGHKSPINAMRDLAEASKASRLWAVIGWMGVIAGFLILSYYAVIAGWALNYIWLMGAGSFEGATADSVAATFGDFTGNPWQVIAWQTVFMILTIWIVRGGVSKGLERAIQIFMPLLFVLLIVLLGYSVTSEGFDEGLAFMFDLKFDAVTPETWLIAMGQAFFTLSLGMGAMMAYGAYVTKETNIATTVVTIAVLDTVVAIAAGLAIFPIVFANGLEPSSGPGLMFVTIPLAFGQLPLGAIFGTVFFVLVSFAAITSAISLTEPALAYLVEEYNAKRSRVAISLGVICWLIGLGSVFSFNIWDDLHIIGTSMTIFDFVDYVSQNIMLPLGGLLIAAFAIWVMPKALQQQQLSLFHGGTGWVWKFVAGVIAPLGVTFVFLNTLFPQLLPYLRSLLG